MKLDDLSRSILEAITRSPKVQQILLSLDSDDLLRGDSYIIVSLRPAGGETGGAIPHVEVESRHGGRADNPSEQRREWGRRPRARSRQAEGSASLIPGHVEWLEEDETWLRQIGLRFRGEARPPSGGRGMRWRQSLAGDGFTLASRRVSRWLLRLFRVFMLDAGPGED